jgi:hypothetical protein
MGPAARSPIFTERTRPAVFHQGTHARTA